MEAEKIGVGPLAKYAEKGHSQRGEEGIIRHILEVVPETPRWCVEFGAWDGKHLSNTYALMDRPDWSGVFIEGSERRFQDLKKTYEENPRAHCLCDMVGWDDADKLDSVLAKTPIPKSFGILSIDIDGNDYHVWEPLTAYRPTLVVIEYNPTIPPHIEFTQPRDHAVNQGNSLAALVKLGKRKGYELVHATSLNAFFIEEKYFPRFEVKDNSPEALYSGHRNLIECFQLYDGTFVFVGKPQLYWHGVSLRSLNIPKFFRVFPERMSPAKLLIFKVWRKTYNALVQVFCRPVVFRNAGDDQ